MVFGGIHTYVSARYVPQAKAARINMLCARDWRGGKICAVETGSLGEILLSCRDRGGV
jgi:hypothetical protein